MLRLWMPRLLVAAIALGLTILPAAGALAGIDGRDSDTDAPTVSVRLVTNPQLWAVSFFAQLKVALTTTSLTGTVKPQIGIATPKPIVKPDPDPDPDPPPVPFGGGGNCPTCSGGGNGGDTGNGSDPDGG